jgi:hypothetical protein
MAIENYKYLSEQRKVIRALMDSTFWDLIAGFRYLEDRHGVDIWFLRVILYEEYESIRTLRIGVYGETSQHCIAAWRGNNGDK